MTILVVVLYLLPLCFFYIVLGAYISLIAALVCMIILKFELNALSVTRSYSNIYIDKNGIWQITDQGGNSQGVRFKNSMQIGSALFVLFTQNGRKKRALVLENHQDEGQFHRLRVYLQCKNSI